MNLTWKDVAGVVGKSAPILGSLLGGPAGGLVGTMIASALGTGASPDEISQALIASPDAAVKLKQIEATRQVELQGLVVQAAANQLTADTAQIQAVNATMIAETNSEHWASWLWRPFLGFITGLMVFGCYFVLPLLGIKSPDVPANVWMMLGAILGVASWFRGVAQADPRNSAPIKG